MTDTRPDHMLSLTEDEAMGLLDIVMMSPQELTPEQRTAAEKLSNFCRELIRREASANGSGSGHSAPKTPAYATY